MMMLQPTHIFSNKSSNCHCNKTFRHLHLHLYLTGNIWIYIWEHLYCQRIFSFPGSTLVVVSECQFIIWKQMVSFETWDNWDIWSEWQKYNAMSGQFRSLAMFWEQDSYFSSSLSESSLAATGQSTGDKWQSDKSHFIFPVDNLNILHKSTFILKKLDQQPQNFHNLESQSDSQTDK